MSEAVNIKHSQIISKVLAPAIKLWLRSQVQQVSHLDVKITGSDRQILTGNIPSVSIFARDAVYQGLHLSEVQLLATEIKINLGQVLRGKPLRLLESFPVLGELLLQTEDLNASLHSPLLNNALTELLLTLIPTSYAIDEQIVWHHIILNDHQLVLNGSLGVDPNKPTSVVICTEVKLANYHELNLEKIQIQIGTYFVSFDNFQIDLGSEVNIQELDLSASQLICRGYINVIPT